MGLILRKVACTEPEFNIPHTISDGGNRCGIIWDSIKPREQVFRSQSIFYESANHQLQCLNIDASWADFYLPGHSPSASSIFILLRWRRLGVWVIVSCCTFHHGGTLRYNPRRKSDTPAYCSLCVVSWDRCSPVQREPPSQRKYSPLRYRFKNCIISWYLALRS